MYLKTWGIYIPVSISIFSLLAVSHLNLFQDRCARLLWVLNHHFIASVLHSQELDASQAQADCKCDA